MSRVDYYDRVFSSVGRVLGVFAHPDDMEINCAGLVARLRHNGVVVRLVTMTAGDRGVQDRDISLSVYNAQRIRALGDAAEALGISSDQVVCLDIPDGAVEDSIENIGQVVWQIREFRPDIVITHDPSQRVQSLGPQGDDIIWLNHRDHRHTASVVFDAVYPYSRDRAFFPEQLDKGLTVHAVHSLLFGDAYDKARAVTFDITDFRVQKAEALRLHLATGSISQDEYDAYTSEGEDDGRWYETLGWLHDFH